MDNSDYQDCRIFDKIVSFFKQESWYANQIGEQLVLQMTFQGENGRWNCFAAVIEEIEQFVFYSICPIKVPEYKHLAIANFLTRANCGMIIGNFELHFDNGEIRYKTSIGVEGDKLSFAIIKNLVYTNVIVMDKYLPGIISVIYQDASSSEAIAKIEAS